MIPRYRIHGLTGQSELRCCGVSCLSNSGIAIGPYHSGGDDLGLAVWHAPYEGRSSSPREFLSAADASVGAINDAGQFVGYQLKDNVEHALLGAISACGSDVPSALERSDVLGANLVVWKRTSAALGINANGDHVGFRQRRGKAIAYLYDQKGDIIDLDCPDDAQGGCYAAAINDCGTIVGATMGGPGLLVWSSVETKFRRVNVDIGQPLRITNTGQILCSYGVADHDEEFWFPNAPGCTDFIAHDINEDGFVVGTGRPLQRDHQNVACLWGPDAKSWRLSDLLVDSSVYLSRATAINDRGWIAADGFLLEPAG